jgi:hypothetical protein
MNARRLLYVFAALLVCGSSAFAVEPAYLNAGSKIRGDYYHGYGNLQGRVYTQAPVQRNVVVAPAPQMVQRSAPVQNVAPAPNATADAGSAQRRSTRTFSVQPEASAPVMNSAPMRYNYAVPQSRGWNLRADRKIRGYHGYGL